MNALKKNDLTYGGAHIPRVLTLDSEKFVKNSILQLIRDKRYRDGSIYNGQMKGSKRHGYGIQMFENGVYQGQWEDD